jgi:aldose 1-epimerase
MSGQRSIRLEAPGGARAEILTTGASVRDLLVPMPEGPRRVVLGYADPAHYHENPRSMGVIVGRYANRIRDARFTLDGRTYPLPTNERGRHHIHGGLPGFGRRDWSVLDEGPDFVELGLLSPDGENGFPGTVMARCRHTLLPPATLRIDLWATTDAPTLVNLAHHSYFNLLPGSDARAHRLMVAADLYTPFDADNIPTGEVAVVADTNRDFRTIRPIADSNMNGNYVIRGEWGGERPRLAARVEAPDGSLALECRSTEPGLQVYDANALDDVRPGHPGQTLGPYAGFCLEPQRFPDSPNQPHFPSPVLRPGQVYRQVTEYRFIGG